MREVVEEIHPVDLTDEEVVSEGFEANYPKFDERKIRKG